ncbi:MAG: AI-2E family transporter [Eubacterium sp.]|nr:AI-2E family transporter [Eubacterium sp.]
MKKLERLLEKPWAAYTFAACSAVLLFLVLSHLTAVLGVFKTLLSYLSPVIIGVIIAYLLNPISEFFEDKVFMKIKKETARHTAGVVATLLCFVLALALLLLALIPSLVQSISKLVANWTVYAEKLQSVLQKATALAQRFGIALDLSDIPALFDQYKDNALELLKNNSGTIFQTLGSIGTSVSNFGIGVVFGFCFLEGEKVLLSMARNIRLLVVKKERYERHNGLLYRCNRVFLRYVGCTLLDALIVGIVTLIFNLIVGVPYAPLIAVVVAITNIIPTFGPIIGAAIGLFFIILESPIKALWFLIFIVVLQAIDGTIIKTKLFSGSLGISGVWTMVLILIGGKFAGVAGIILAIPLAAVCVIIYQETIMPRMEKRYAKLNTEQPDSEQELN